MSGPTESTRLALVLSENGRFRAEISLDRERLRIGRRPYNDLVLDDLTVSGEHALVQIRPEGCLIRDLDSRNGTHVNGRPIVECLLAEGDSIDIGIYRLRLAGAVSGAAGQAEVPIAGPAVAVAIEQPTGSAAGRAVAEGGTQAAVDATAGLQAVLAEPASGERPPDAAPLPAMPLLEYLSGPYAGITQRIDRNILRIGNGDAQAAVIARRRSGWFMTHLEGGATPVVNGVAIGPAASPLADGDLIELAGARIRFRLPG
ncbi:MAG: FHA domain-containing protein [Burkholderiaceae bacterium]|nr:FHA domain-containing protein [Burkholderiaceae bacterium]